jgi:hypothetical protein
MKACFAMLIATLAGLHCIGNRQTVKLNELNYAVSMTPVIYGSDGVPKAEGVGLEVIGDIEVSRRYWSLVYSLVPLGDTKLQLQNFNNVITARGAQGVINFEIENEGCDLNNFAYVVVPAVLPFFPGCSKITMRGRLVRETFVRRR